MNECFSEMSSVQRTHPFALSFLFIVEHVPYNFFPIRIIVILLVFLIYLATMVGKKLGFIFIFVFFPRRLNINTHRQTDMYTILYSVHEHEEWKIWAWSELDRNYVRLKFGPNSISIIISLEQAIFINFFTIHFVWHGK